MRVPFALAFTLAATVAANAQGSFPCQAFQMQPNGMLLVVQPVTITGPNGQASLNQGMSFGPGTAMMGANIYEMYKQACR